MLVFTSGTFWSALGFLIALPIAIAIIIACEQQNQEEKKRKEREKTLWTKTMFFPDGTPVYTSGRKSQNGQRQQADDKRNRRRRTKHR